MDGFREELLNEVRGVWQLLEDGVCVHGDSNDPTDHTGVGLNWGYCPGPRSGAGGSPHAPRQADRTGVRGRSRVDLGEWSAVVGDGEREGSQFPERRGPAIGFWD